MIDCRIEAPPQRQSKTDCVVRAIASASGRPYPAVAAMLGPEVERWKGYTARQYVPVLKQLGFVRVAHGRLLDMASMLPHRNYVALIRAHAIAIVKGKAIDTWHSTGRTRRRRLMDLWVAP